MVRHPRRTPLTARELAFRSAAFHAARVSCALSVRDLADAIGVSIRTVQLWEKAETRPRPASDALTAACWYMSSLRPERRRLSSDDFWERVA